MRSTKVPRPSGTWAIPAFAAASGLPLSGFPSRSIAPLRATVPEIARSPQHPGQGTLDALADWGIPQDRIDKLVESGAVVTT